MEKILNFPQVPQTEHLQQLPAKKPPKPKPRNMTSDGRRCVRVDIGYDPLTGKRIRKACYGKTLKEAHQKANEVKQALQNGMNVTQQRQTLSQWIDTWMHTYGQKAGYSANISQALDADKLRKQLGRIKLTDIRQIHIQAFADSVSDYSKSGVNKIRITTNQIFRAAIANRIIAINPCDGVQWKHAGGGTHRRLEDWELRLIINHWRVHRAGMWAMLLLFTGMRRGELLALKWEDIDLNAGIIHVKSGVHFEGNSPVLGEPKTASSVRDIPILPPLYDVLTTTPRTSDTWVCTGERGQAVTESIWSSSWRTWQRAMNNLLRGSHPSAYNSCPDDENILHFSVRAHDFRHTFASMLFDADVDLKTAQTILGHATSEITMDIYTHLSHKRQSDSLTKMAVYTQNMVGNLPK